MSSQRHTLLIFPGHTDLPDSKSEVKTAALKILELQHSVDNEIEHLDYIRQVLHMSPGPTSGRLRRITVRNAFRDSILPQLCELRYPPQLISWINSVRALARQISEQIDCYTLAIHQLRTLVPNTRAFHRKLDSARQASARAFLLTTDLSEQIGHLNRHSQGLAGPPVLGRGAGTITHLADWRLHASQPEKHTRPATAQAGGSAMGLLTSDQHRWLKRKMAGMPGMNRSETRQAIAESLPPWISEHIALPGAISSDLDAIISAVDRGDVRLKGGKWPIELLVEELNSRYEELEWLDEIVGVINEARADREQHEKATQAEQTSRPPIRQGQLHKATQAPLVLEPLQRQLTKTLRYLRHLTELLDIQPHPTEQRLRRVIHIRALQNEVLPALIHLRYEDLGSNEIPREQAVRQLDTARQLARTAGTELDACQRAVGELLQHVSGERSYIQALDRARGAAKQANQRCSQLREHLRCWVRECRVYTGRAA